MQSEGASRIVQDIDFVYGVLELEKDMFSIWNLK